MINLYLDNALMRWLLDNEKYHQKFNEDIETNLNEEYTFLSGSYYQFFEYYGCDKLGIHKQLKEFEKLSVSLDINLSENIDAIGSILFPKIRSHIEDLLMERKILLYNLVTERSKYEASSPKIKDLKDKLFGGILQLIDQDFKQFAYEMAIYLSWDVFCDMQITKHSVENLRQIQLGVWSQCYEGGYIFHLGKIVDDLTQNYLLVQLERNSWFKGKKDMVDADGLTYALLGDDMIEGSRQKIYFITADSPLNISQRLSIMMGAMLQLEAAIPMSFERTQGKIFHFCRNCQNLIHINTIELNPVKTAVALPKDEECGFCGKHYRMLIPSVAEITSI